MYVLTIYNRNNIDIKTSRLLNYIYTYMDLLGFHLLSHVR